MLFLMHECTLCRRVYRSNNTLVRHQRNHDSSKRYTCTVCGVSFHRSDLLKRHLSNHAKTGPVRQQVIIACQQCCRLKKRCDGVTPCSRCEARGLQCSFRTVRYVRKARDGGEPSMNPVRTTRQEHLECPVVQQSDRQRLALGGQQNDSLQSGESTMVLQALSERSDSDDDQSFEIPVQKDGKYSAERLFGPHQNATPSQCQLLRELSELTQYKQLSNHNLSVSTPDLWSDMSRRAELLFELGSVMPETRSHRFDQFVTAYYEKIHIHWPIFTTSSDNAELLPPVLYLSIVALGAMLTGNDTDSDADTLTFGSMLHEAITSQLLSKIEEESIPNDAALQILQALHLQQTSALCFGKGQAFTSAQALSVTATRFARKQGLFDDPAKLTSSGSYGDDSTEMLQMRSALVFGMYRLEIYMNALFGHQPMLSYVELALPVPEIDLQPKRCHNLGNKNAINKDCKALQFNVLVELCKRERTPVDLRPNEQYLMFYATQELVYQHGRDIPGETESEGLKLLSKYPPEQTIPSLSALLSHHIVQMRLNSPLNVLHRIPANNLEDQNQYSLLIDAARRWATTPAAFEATRVACSVYTLLRKVLDLPEDEQLPINLFGVIGLHHAAVIIWIFAGCHSRLALDPGDVEQLPSIAVVEAGAESRLYACRENAFSIVTDVARLCKKVNHYGFLGRCFIKTAWHMAVNPFAELLDLGTM